jgi:hypothetical protein
MGEDTTALSNSIINEHLLMLLKVGLESAIVVDRLKLPYESFEILAALGYERVSD